MTQPPPEPPAPALEVRGLHKRYGRHSVLHDIDLAVTPGEVYALTGPNGAGKSTLIRTVTGLAFPTSGTVRVGGVDLDRRGALGRRHAADQALRRDRQARQRLADHPRRPLPDPVHGLGVRCSRPRAK